MAGLASAAADKYVWKAPSGTEWGSSSDNWGMLSNENGYFFNNSGGYNVVLNNNILVTFNRAYEIPYNLKFENNGNGNGLVVFRANQDHYGVSVGNGNNIILGWDNALGALKLERGTFAASGSVNVKGGAISVEREATLACTNSLYVGNSDGHNRSGRLAVYGGKVRTGGDVLIACNSSYPSECIVSPGSIVAAGDIVVGQGGDGKLTVAGGGVVSGRRAVIASGSSAKGEIRLEPAGMLEVESLYPGSGSSRSFKWDGGVLKAKADSASFVPDSVSVSLGERGAIVETAGHNVTISARLDNASGIGGNAPITKIGSGVLTLARSLDLARTFRFAFDRSSGPIALSGGSTLASGKKISIEVNPAHAALGVRHTLMTGLGSGYSLERDFDLKTESGYYTQRLVLENGTLSVVLGYPSLTVDGKWSPENAVWEVRDERSGLLHPGIGLNRDDILRIIKNVKDGVEPWASDYLWLTMRDQAFSTNARIYTDRSRWTAIDDQGYDRQCESDSRNAICQAFMYIATGDIRHREYAMDFIRWTYRTIKSGRAHWDSQFRWPNAERWFVMACELCRYSGPREGDLAWTDEDTAGVDAFISIGENMWWGRTMLLNQLQFALGGPLARGVYRNDRALYDEMVEVMTYNADGPVGERNGSIREMCRLVVSNDVTGAAVTPHYQYAEMGRDIGHPVDGASILVVNLALVRAQGTLVDPVRGTVSLAADAVEPIEYLGDQTLKAVNAICKYNLGAEIDWTPIYISRENNEVWWLPCNWGGGRGRLAPQDILYSHYRWKRNMDFEASEDTRYIAYASRLRGSDLFNRFFWTAKEAAGKWKDESINPGGGEYNRFAEFVLPPTPGVSKKKNDGDGMDYLSARTDRFVFPLYLQSRRPLPEPGVYAIRYRSSGKCGMATINPEDYDTEYYDGTNQTKRIYIEEVELPSTDGKWRTHVFRLEKPPARNLVRLEFRAESGAIDVEWLRIPGADNTGRNEWRPLESTSNSWGDSRNWSYGADATGCAYCFNDGATVLDRKIVVSFDKPYVCPDVIRIENDSRGDGTGEVVFMASSSAAGVTSRHGWNIIVGDSGRAAGNLRIKSGTYRGDNAVIIQSGRILVEGGVLESGNNFHTSYDRAGSSALDVAGGEVRVGNGLFLGCVAGLLSKCNVSGGYITTGNLCSIGESGMAELEISGGIVDIGTDLVFARNAGSAGTCRLVGGVLAANSISIGNGKQSALILDGGTLKAKSSQGAFIAANDMLDVIVGSQGAVFDTAGYNVTIPATLKTADGATANGPIAKKGLGTLTISSNLDLARTFRFEIDGGIGPVALTGSGNYFGNGSRIGIEISPVELSPGTAYILMTGLPSSVSLSNLTLPSNGFYNYSWSLSGGTLKVTPTIASGYAATARYVRGGWWIFDANGKDFHGTASPETVFIFSGVEPAGEFARMASGRRVSIEIAKSNGRGVTNTIEVASEVTPASISISCETGCAVRFVGSGSAKISTERFSNGGNIVVGGNVELDVAPLSGNCHVENGAKLTLASSQTVSAAFSGPGTVAFADGTFRFADVSVFDAFSGTVEIASGSYVYAPVNGQNVRLGSGRVAISGGVLHLGNGTDVMMGNDVYVTGGTSGRLWSNRANMHVNGDITGSGTLAVGTDNERGPRLNGDNSAFSGNMIVRHTSAQYHVGVSYAKSSSANAAWTILTDNSNRDIFLNEGGTFKFGSIRMGDPFANLRAPYAGTQIEIGARSVADSLIAGRLVGEPMALAKVGARTCLTLGTNFNAVAGTSIDVRAGALGFVLPLGNACASLTNCAVSLADSARLRVEMTASQYLSLGKDEPGRVVALLAKVPDNFLTTEICVDGKVVETANVGSRGWHVVYRYVAATPDVAAHCEAVLEYGAAVPPTAGNSADNEWQVTGGIGASTEWSNWRNWTKPLGEGLNSRFGSGAGVYNRNVLVTFSEACQGDGEIKFENDERGNCVGCVVFRAETDDAGVRTASGRNMVLGWDDMRGCLQVEKGTYSAGNAILVQSGNLFMHGGALSCGGNMHVGYGRARDAAVFVSGGAITVGNRFEVGCVSGFASGATVTGGSLASGGNFRIGISGDAGLLLDDGDLSCGNEFWLGNDSGVCGTFTMNGGSFASSSYTCVGYGNGSGVFTMNAGEYTQEKQKFIVGQAANPNATGVCTVNGGAITVPQLWLAERQTPGTLNMNGGEFTVTGTAQMSRNSASGRGVINLNGGVLTVSRFEAGNASGAGGEIVFNGGTLKANASASDFIPASDTIDLVIAENGAVFDTAGFNVTVADSFANAEGMSGNGKIVKKGAGTLTLSAPMELSRTFGIAVDGDTGPIALSSSDNTLSRNTKIAVEVDSVNVDTSKKYTVLTGLDAALTLGDSFDLPESDGFYALTWTFENGALSVQFAQTDNSPVTARYVDRTWKFYNANGQLIDGGAGSDETTYIFTGAEPSNDLLNISKTHAIIFEAVRANNVAVTNRIAIAGTVEGQRISVNIGDGCGILLVASGENAAIRSEGLAVSGNVIVSGTLRTNAAFESGSISISSGGQLVIETPQKIGAAVSGEGRLTLSGGKYSFAEIGALDAFSGVLELRDAQFDAPIRSDQYLALGNAIVEMRGAEMYVGNYAGSKISNSLRIVACTENLIRASQANIFVFSAISGAGKLTLRTDGARGPRLDGDNSQFMGTIVLRNTSTQLDTGFRRASSVGENAKFIVETDDKSRVFDIAGGGTYKFGALVQEDVTTTFRVVNSGTKIEIGALEGEVSVVNGGFSNNSVAIRKIGETSTLKLGQGFHAVNGTSMAVDEGMLGFDFDISGAKVTSLANCSVAMDSGSYIRVDMTAADFAALGAGKEYPVAEFASNPGTERTAVFVDGALISSVSGWRIAYAASGGKVVAKLKYHESEKAKDVYGNTFTVPVGWNAEFPEGTTVETTIPGTSMTYAQAYALGLADGNGELTAPKILIDLVGGSNGTVAYVSCEAGPNAAKSSAYSVRCHLEKSPDLYPWAGSEVATGNLGAAMRDDVGSATRMFYKVNLEIKDR